MKYRWAAAVVILSVVIYLPVLKNEFVFDDHGLIEENTYIRDLSNVPTLVSTDLWDFYYPEYQTKRIRYWRPLMLSSWAVVHRIFGLNPVGFHLTSILVHGLCTLLVFLVGREMLRDDQVAATAAAIFALHPVHIDAVAWASGFSDPLVAAFALATLGSYHCFRTRGSPWWGIAALGFLTFTLLSKESGIMVPVVLVTYELLLAPRERRAHSLALLGVSFIMVPVYLMVRRGIMGPMDTKLFAISLSSIPPTLTVVFGHYARLLLFPVHLVSTYPIHIYTSFLEPDVLKAIFYIILFGLFLSVVLRGRKNLFWVLFLGLTLLPTLNVVGLATDLLGERYLYLPSVGFCFLLADLIMVRLPKFLPSRASAIVLALLLVGYAVRDMTRFPDWRDELTYLTVTLRDAPDAYIHLNNFGNYLYRSEPRDLERAQKAFEKAAALAPDYEHPQSNLAIVFLEKGQLEHALQHALRASDIQSGWVDPLISAAEAAGRMGRTGQARDLLQKVLSLEPENAMAHNNMGSVAFLEGDVQEAIEWWTKNEELDPSNKSVLYNLALGYEKLGQTEEAALYYKRFSEEAPPGMHKMKQEATRKAEELASNDS